jgi:D-sedoheptulose 7-phosphate isomerase
MINDRILNELCNRRPELAQLRDSIADAANTLISTFENGGKLLACGNGGSSSDADHIVGELMKSFEASRPLRREITERLLDLSPERGKYLSGKLESGLPAISLSSQTSLTSAICNDIGADMVFAQQVASYGTERDVLIAISTSGNSQNVVDACIMAKALNMRVIGLTGATGGKMKEFCDVLLNVPEKRTAYVQELHLPVFHALCLLVEDHFYPNKKLLL